MTKVDNYSKSLCDIKQSLQMEIKILLAEYTKGNRWDFAYLEGGEPDEENDEEVISQWDYEECPWIDYPVEKYGDYSMREGQVKSIFLADDTIYLDILDYYKPIGLYLLSAEDILEVYRNLVWDMNIKR